LGADVAGALAVVVGVEGGLPTAGAIVVGGVRGAPVFVWAGAVVVGVRAGAAGLAAGRVVVVRMGRAAGAGADVCANSAALSPSAATPAEIRKRKDLRGMEGSFR